ncbi:SigE family RNA polymerase sigma factor [Dactylosporangium sp. NPDC000555]|uniref:SigE family RNA polymerase sigma factor n=1 Tax=Dactylosporangium sp. NPDC000555 TaxID=3154260 RepID=UPI003323FC1F
MRDAEAEFRDFVSVQLEPLRGLAYLTCGDWQAGEDAVLTVLARLYARWRHIDNPLAYVRTAVVRAAIDETRRPWWRREQAAGDALPDRALPDDGTGEVDERLRVRAALLRLPPRLRAVLVLRFLEGLSVQQTAEALGCPEGTVKGYTSRGLDGLRQILGVDVSIEEHAEGRHEIRTA